jgi:hypothetical protein
MRRQPQHGSPVPGAAPAGGWSGRCADGPGASGGIWPRGGTPVGPGASAALSRAGSAAGAGRAPPMGAGAAGRPGTPGRQGRTAAGSYPAAAPAPRSGGAAPGFPRPCPGRSPEVAAVTRTRWSQPGKRVEAAQPVIMPQQADSRRATSSSGRRRNQIATPTWADEIFGTGNFASGLPVYGVGLRPSVQSPNE